MPKFARDVERLRHFQQEALAARMLKYPSIIAIYDMGARDGSPYLVAEQFEAGALPLRRYVEYAQQIASELAESDCQTHHLSNQA